MSFRENQAAINRRRDLMTDQTDDPLELGFGASVSTAFEQFRAEDVTNSESRAVERFQGIRNRSIDSMVEAGEIPAEVVDEHTRAVGMNQINGMTQTELDYHGLAAWANENTGAEFEADDAEMIRTMRWERNQRQRALANGNMAGELIGTMGAALTDPVLLGATLVTLPFGPGSLPATGVLRSVVARAALVEGMVGVATEIPIQEAVEDFKYRIDSPFTFEDKVRNILTAGAASAALGGTVQLAALGAHRYLLNRRPEQFLEDSAAAPSNPDTVRLAEELDQLRDVPDAPDSVGGHLDRLLEAEQRLNHPEAPEYTPQAREAEQPQVTADGLQDDLAPLWEPEDPREWDLEIETEAGEVRTLRDLDEQYQAELRGEEEQLDALVSCTLLPRGVL
ncbi:hypothetical protein CWI75_10695 [Kineobactrum sediminis]|uniref:Uncharacterized protein n=1 Tax=Kineobactrum sediminis TaxID=1905677 RepID=A0A2N5Y1H1_9GAMM|nr:hypothetical protein [Kineobactrum sediminis]PLW82238.1 hypothetical protein CWI75_10695 [Kineobactrum sediminis]